MSSKRVFIPVLLIAAFIAAGVMAQEATPAKPDTAAQAKPKNVVQLVTVEPFDYCAVEMTGDFQQHGFAFETLYSEVQAQGVMIQDAPFGVYYNSPDQVPVDSLKWEIGQVMSEKKDLTAPLKLKRWGYTTLAAIEYDGAFNSPEMANVYGSLFAWIGQNGYVPAGPFMEAFLNMPGQTADGGWGGHVRISIPVQKQPAQ
ncbi:MAG TPA: GyrI-like domain-containing protein [bacterium]